MAMVENHLQARKELRSKQTSEASLPHGESPDSCTTAFCVQL